MPATVAPVRWFGGKALLARTIANLLPPHRAYVEPFGGSGCVLFAKEPSALDVWNDVDGGLVTFYRVLRERPEDLARSLRLTPFSREEWRACRESWAEVEDEVERARRWYVRTNQAFGADPYATGWGGERTGRAHRAKSRSWARTIDDLLIYAERWRGVQVESLDWRAVLDKYDDPSGCFYLDPPYLPETRKSGLYAHELTTDDHAELLERAQDLRAGVVISGYDSAIYRDALERRGGFERYEYAVVCAAAALHGRSERSPRLEVVWRRGDHQAPRLFEVGA